MNIMDYSLIVGMDAKGNMYIGIVDILRTWTWDKKLEMIVKKSGILGNNKEVSRAYRPVSRMFYFFFGCTNQTLGSYKQIAIAWSQQPTVLSPREYCDRFRKALNDYLVVVPDRWDAFRS